MNGTEPSSSLRQGSPHSLSRRGLLTEVGEWNHVS
jgi:hypothetical protein